MKKYLLLLFLAGCGGAEKEARALQEVFSKCDSQITMTYHKNSWSKGLELTCQIDNLDD